MHHKFLKLFFLGDYVKEEGFNGLNGMIKRLDYSFLFLLYKTKAKCDSLVFDEILYSLICKRRAAINAINRNA